MEQGATVLVADTRTVLLLTCQCGHDQSSHFFNAGDAYWAKVKLKTRLRRITFDGPWGSRRIWYEDQFESRLVPSKCWGACLGRGCECYMWVLAKHLQGHGA